MTIRSLSRRVHRRRDLLYPLLGIAIALIALRAALPYIVKDYVNGRLHALDAYDGRVADIDIGLWRGAYRIDGLEIVKKGGKQRTPFFDSERVDFSVEWHSLLNGRLVSEAHFYQPKLNLVESRSKKRSQLGTEENWHSKLEELFPFRFNTVEVHGGTITFRAPGIESEDALTARKVNGIITNITNVEETDKPTFAEFRIVSDLLGDAPAYAFGSAKPFTNNSTFDLNFAVENVKIPKVNPWLREYLKADAESGDFDLYLEIASANGHYEGYAKPMLEDVRFIGIDEPGKQNPVKTLWSATLQLAAELFENQPRQQVAAQIPFSGSIQGTQTDLLTTIASVFRNAFLGAFAHSIEERISMQDVTEGDSSG